MYIDREEALDYSVFLSTLSSIASSLTLLDIKEANDRRSQINSHDPDDTDFSLLSHLTNLQALCKEAKQYDCTSSLKKRIKNIFHCERQAKFFLGGQLFPPRSFLLGLL